MAELKHPNIEQIYDVLLDPLGIVMEWTEGISLQDKIDSQQLSITEICNLGIKLSDCLAYIHKRGIVHRNIKPGNITIQKYNGEPILHDFRISRSHGFVDIALRQDGAYGYVGTPQYSAPEQFLDPKSVGTSADLFALGVVLYELLTGEKPYLFGNNPTVYDEKKYPALQRLNIPPKLFSIINSLLHKNPTMRPAAVSLKLALQNFLNLFEEEKVEQ